MIAANPASDSLNVRIRPIVRAVVYSRVSTDAQEQDGTSLETQERACLERAEELGWSVVDRIRDTASGATLERPGMTRARDMLRRGEIGRLVVYAVDRLSRNQNHLGILLDEVEQADASFEIVTEEFENTTVGRLILQIRGFAAEFEREKIRERTMRGKLERARSGRIPQAMGRGTYGYIYNPATGRREIDPVQAEVVRQVFQRYAETRSYGQLSRELNEGGITAFQGGRWYPLTIRRILSNESYTGRFTFRRTKWVASRTGSDKKLRRRPTPRPEEEWIEIEGASPRIVDEAAWQRVREILADPVRILRGTKRRSYALRGHIRCGICGFAMVGQTMTSKGNSYRYYGCPHVYSRHTGHDCTAHYVRADGLESGIWSEVRKVLSNPEIVLQELQEQHGPPVDAQAVARLEKEIRSIGERERRLVKLFTFGEIDEDVIRDEGASLRSQRAFLEARLQTLEAPRGGQQTGIVDQAMLERACAGVAEWLDRAGDADRKQVMEALQLSVLATTEEAVLTGVLPGGCSPEFCLNEQSCR